MLSVTEMYYRAIKAGGKGILFYGVRVPHDPLVCALLVRIPQEF